MSDLPKIGSICHIEIPAPNLDAAKAFFTELFGWEIHPMNDDYALFHAGDSGGGLDKTATVADGGAIPVIAVEDIDATLTKIRATGGDEVSGKTEISGGHGYYAYFRDPNGNKLGLWQKA